MTDRGLVERLQQGDPSLFRGPTAAHSLGWVRHPERYLGVWLDDTSRLLPRRHGRTLLLGMGGSSSPARLYAEARLDAHLTVLDTSSPDTVAETDFGHATVIASSKSGDTIETRTLLDHALANGLDPRDLVVISDPGTSLVELATSLGALLIEGDPDTGGRFSALSPFGLVPALYAGWTPDELRAELADCFVTDGLVREAIDEADRVVDRVDDGAGWFPLGTDPITSGGALWLEQLVAETTGKDGRGFIPVFAGSGEPCRPRDVQRLHLVAALLARHLDVDPFNQPNVESAKKDVFALLAKPVSWDEEPLDSPALYDAMSRSTYNVLQVFAPLRASSTLSELRRRVESRYGTTTANLGPRYLHSTGQLHKGGPPGLVAVQIVQRPSSPPATIAGRPYSFHDLHMAQARSDVRAMRAAGRTVYQLVVEDLDQAAQRLGLGT